MRTSSAMALPSRTKSTWRTMNMGTRVPSLEGTNTCSVTYCSGSKPATAERRTTTGGGSGASAAAPSMQAVSKE
jgi:hypothetical protein